MSGEIIKDEKNSQEKKETRMNYNCESAAESSVRMLALSERPSFNGESVESAKQFMKDLEELFDLVRITDRPDPMLKKYHFKSKLSGLSAMCKRMSRFSHCRSVSNDYSTNTDKN